MVAWLGPLIGAGASLIGGILNRNSAEDQQRQQMNFAAGMSENDRVYDFNTRNAERRYSQQVTKMDRLYAANLLSDERDYAAGVTKDQRTYERQLLANQRAYDGQRLADDRAYMSGQLTDERAYQDGLYQQDLTQYAQDRDRMQIRSNVLADASAASRGIDFQRLRDDAVAAGYNPLTAMSMAHAYSTNVDYQLQGGVYSPRASYQASNLGYSPTSAAYGGGGGVGGSGPAVAGGATPMPSHVPAGGGIGFSGAGYQSQFNPALSSGGFIQEAIERGADSFFNTPPERDPLADALRGALQYSQMADEVRDSRIPDSFGYALTDQKPFRPTATVGVPALAAGKTAMLPAAKTEGFEFPEVTLEIDGEPHVPVRGPNNQPMNIEKSVATRFDINPFDKLVAEDYETIFGDMAGEALSVYDMPIPGTVNSAVRYGPNLPKNTRDYIEYGTTGSPIMRNPFRYNVKKRYQ